MKTFEAINFEELNDDTTETAYYLQEEKCKKLFDEIKEKSDGDLVKQLNRFYDQLFDLKNLSNMIYYKLGIKKAANVFIDGII